MTEIQVFGMITDQKTGDNRIAQRGEVVEFYDVQVRGEEANEEIQVIEEHDDLTYLEMEARVTELEAKYSLTAEYVWGF